MEEEKRSLEEMAACIKAAQKEQVQARNVFAKKLEALGLDVYYDISVDYPQCADYPPVEGKYINMNCAS